MDKLSFSKKTVISKVNYDYDYQINDVKIIKYQIEKFKNTDQYINIMINYIKDNIIKFLQNLKLVKIYMNICDQKNIIHRFIISVSNIIADLLNLKETLNFNKSIFIFIIYENKLVFSGNLDFSHLF